MNIQSPGECFSLSCFVVAARALTNDAEIVLATTHDGIDTDIKRTGIFESADLFANSINFFTNPFVGAVGEHQELHVLPREVSHVGLTVKAVVSHDDRCREAQHLKLP